MMYKSKEIRWFFKGNDTPFARWFSEKGMDHADVAPRTDFYLSIHSRDDISVKLREGNIEIKQKLGHSIPYHLTKNALGILEEWDKWSFHVTETDTLVKHITGEKRTDWIEVYKERVGLKLSFHDGSVVTHDIKDTVPSGCQIEYTRLVINEEEWSTFGLEWFGNEEPRSELPIVVEIVRNTELKPENSMSYSAFLHSLNR